VSYVEIYGHERVKTEDILCGLFEVTGREYSDVFMANYWRPEFSWQIGVQHPLL
jgi:hypothetical protein